MEHPEWVQNLHKLNGILHKEPVASLAYGFFWYLVLLLAAPIGAFGVLFFTAYKVIRFYLWKKDIQPKDHPDKELAVVVTGCDSGESFVWTHCYHSHVLKNTHCRPNFTTLTISVFCSQGLGKSWYFPWFQKDLSCSQLVY